MNTNLSAKEWQSRIAAALSEATAAPRRLRSGKTMAADGICRTAARIAEDAGCTEAQVSICEDMGIVLTLTCPELITYNGSSAALYELTGICSSVTFARAGDSSMQIKFKFDDIWERAHE